MKTVIIGGVAGGMSAATRLRRLQEDAEIIIFEQGPNVSFANCGLPYHVGGIIPKEQSLLLQTPDSLNDRFRLDVRVLSRVTKINKEQKTVTVLNLETKETFDESYDNLVISTGAKPRALPIFGIERAFVLRDVEDAAKIKKQVDSYSRQSAVILGAGFIGIELAENLIHRGVKTTVIQLGSTILPQFDPEIIEPFQAHLQSKGIEMIFNASATAIGLHSVTLSTGQEIPADFVVSAVGVVPDHHLAVDAGLKIGESGAIFVDKHQRTSDQNIFAVGDAAEKTSVFSGKGQQIWLANLANRHGRLVADVIAGEQVDLKQAIGTGIIGAFGMAIAVTGLTEGLAKKLSIPHEIIHLHPSSHAGYFPGAERVSLKVLYNPNTGQILGAQAVGLDGIDKRIDILATCIYASLTIQDLMNLELAYAPAFGSAKDAINQTGYVGDNVISGKTQTVQWHQIADLQKTGTVLVDVRDESENEDGAIPGSLLIPVNTLRENLQGLVGKEVVVHCAVGQRGHTAVQILRGHGIKAKNLSGGYTTWKAGMDALARAAV
jgi:NADPH-dependent 2,4-dienoyl-CoA reductase/sulfur reductase-like enzyme/rhodanese-related sulfurtransferase